MEYQLKTKTNKQTNKANKQTNKQNKTKTKRGRKHSGFPSDVTINQSLKFVVLTFLSHSYQNHYNYVISHYKRCCYFYTACCSKLFKLSNFETYWRFIYNDNILKQTQLCWTYLKDDVTFCYIDIYSKMSFWSTFCDTFTWSTSNNYY